MNLFVFQLSKKPLAAVEFVAPLARIDPIYKEEEEAFKVIVVQQMTVVKDAVYYCYCAYVLRISRYSDFLSPMLTNTGILLRGLKLSGESRS